MNKISFNGRFVHPTKIICVGRNYVEHVAELGNELPTSMVLFMKPISCVRDTLYSKHLNEDVHYEGEISFIIENGKLSGVGFGLDLTKRELQSELKKKELPWERAKCFDGAALFSQFVKIDSDTSSLHVKLYINDKLTQSGGVELMLYKPENILKEINNFSKLENFDIIMTGTPKGVGIVHKGDVFRGEIHDDQRCLISKEWVAL
jgi:2-keto-4-pentenoate hydratase/2-oxohepta-3-ene-1,7-dioic acid hydratase in catechol pathway